MSPEGAKEGQGPRVVAGLILLILLAVISWQFIPQEVPPSPAPPSATPSPSAPTATPSTTPSETPAAPPSTAAGLPPQVEGPPLDLGPSDPMEAPKLKGAFPAGTLYAQVEIRADAVRLLGRFEKAALPFRGERVQRGRAYHALLVDSAGNRALVPFEVRGLLPAGAKGPGTVVGEEVYTKQVPEMIRLPQPVYPAKLTIRDPKGKVLGTLNLEAGE
ncbi:MAG: hypothetical protein JKY65_04210 [Planctomycetes bacterium]|nr:hypothetical protein [Planctomycetota bacterium]